MTLERYGMSTELAPHDLSGDPVYDHLKGLVLPEFDLIGGFIQERKTVGPGEARILISIVVEEKKSKKRTTFDYNYKKLIRKYSL